MDGNPTTYELVLRDAYDMGRCDGRAAAVLGLQDADAESEACRGVGADQFAVQLWERRSGRPPAGLSLNGPHWYAAGFRAGLAEQAVVAAVPAPRRGQSRVDMASAAD